MHRSSDGKGKKRAGPARDPRGRGDLDRLRRIDHEVAVLARIFRFVCIAGFSTISSKFPKQPQ
jgi:hypothetical protein